MSKPNLTYHPILPWRCMLCGASGEVVLNPEQACNITWDRVLEAHAAASPDRAEHGHRGLAIAQPARDLPE